MKNFKLALLILVCVGLTACSNSSTNKERQILNDSNILKTFGDVDFKRMQEYVDRFNDKKGDYVLAIPPIIDGGYTIYDLKSDGNLVTVRMDATRDMYSGRESVYACGSMKIQEDGGKQLLVLDKCEGLEKGSSEVKLFTFNSELTQ